MVVMNLGRLFFLKVLHAYVDVYDCICVFTIMNDIVFYIMTNPFLLYVQVYVSLRISVLLFHVCCRSFLGFFAHKMLCCLENIHFIVFLCDMAMYISILHYL